MKKTYILLLYILLSVKRLFSPTLLLPAIDSMTNVQR